MFLSIFKKFGKIIIDALIIIGIIIIIFIWNPFGIFGGGLKLQNTANIVEEIKSIGQLVTAEYYGEVISTYNDVTLDINNISLLEEEVNYLYIELKESIKSSILNKYKNKDEKFNRRERNKYKEEYIKKNTDALMLVDTVLHIESPQHPFVLYLSDHEWNLNIRKRKYKKLKENEKLKHAKNLLKKGLEIEYNRIYDQVVGDSRYESYSSSGLTNKTPFVDFLAKLDDDIEKDEKKVELAIIGRGSVKAGIDFGMLTEDNLVYSEEQKRIFISGVKVEVLDKDINPWFIPEKRIPGYDILLANKHAGFEEMKKLKVKCIEKLEIQAREAGIVYQAEKNAKESLKSFFSLLTGNEIEEVIFKENVLISDAKTIIKDGFIDFDELVLIDRTYKHVLNQINSEKDSALRSNYKKQLKKYIRTFQSDNSLKIKAHLSLSEDANLQIKQNKTLELDSELITKDSIIELNEYLQINDFYLQLLDSIKFTKDSLKLVNYKEKRYALYKDFELSDSNLVLETLFDFSYFNKAIPILFREKFLTIDDFKAFTDLRFSIVTDTNIKNDLLKSGVINYWFDDELEYLCSYNDFINILKSKYALGANKVAIYTVGDTIDIYGHDEYQELPQYEIIKQETISCSCKVSLVNNYLYRFRSKPENLDSLKYPITINYETIEDLIKRDEILDYDSINITPNISHDSIIIKHKEHEIIAIKQNIHSKNREYNKGGITKVKRKTKDISKNLINQSVKDNAIDFIDEAKTKVKELKDKFN